MRKVLLALAAVAVIGGCSDTKGPTSPTTSQLENSRDSAAATAFPGQENGGLLLTAEMTGPAEVPVPGDPDGSGSARITLNAGLEQVCFALEVTGIDPTTAAHIHAAPAGQPGSIVVPLAPPTSGSSSGCTSASRDLITSIIRNPEGYYVNVHNPEFRGGALRGQLSR